MNERVNRISTNELNRGRTLGQRTHESTQVISLLEFTIANLDNVTQIPANLVQESTTNAAFSCKQSVQRILIVRALSGQRLEVLW